jgi:LysM repeat protein
VDEIMTANPSVDPNFLSQGQEIIIPGLEDITGVLDTEVISFGDSLRSLSRRTQVSDEQLIKLNRLVSPSRRINRRLIRGSRPRRVNPC